MSGAHPPERPSGRSTPVHRIELYGTGPEELADLLGGSGRAQLVWKLIREGADPFATERLSPGAARRLAEACADLPVRVTRREVAADATTKLRLALPDKRAVEAVAIPGRGRTTVCVSTQIGCARECGFCVTARMGLVRSLSVAEIVGQVILARREAADQGLPPTRNVVFMGMGEPLDNLDAVLRSIEILIHPHALGLAPRHITISTVGTSPQAIHRLEETSACLAWSVHAVDDALRRELIPTSRHAMTELRDAFLRVVTRRRSHLFVEMTLLDGVNDELQHAEALATFLEPFRPQVRINLLPMNLGREGYRPSPMGRVVSFRQHLRGRGYFSAIRKPRGADRAAACGQLATGSDLAE